ncbi:MAG: hypothetical protein ASARMPRED_003289 [Alectoria sarmentosa]|nr:MAG: hypothetical protein ASARMPRED_003289 [Alectoria sarmentosa]
MLSPPPSVMFVALLVFTSFQFRIFNPQISTVAHNDQRIANTFSMTLSTTYNTGASVFDPLLPDILRPKIRQVSMRVYNATNITNNILDERCMATHLEYGKKWGYPTHILREDVKGKGHWNELLFSKPLYILSLAIAEMAKPVDERAEWLVFFDSDTILLNPNIPWTLFLPPSDFPSIHFLGGRDWGDGNRDWGDGRGFNAGVFFVRVNEWSVKMLTEVAALPDLRTDLELGFNAEQTAFKWVFKRVGYREHVLYQPVEWFNGFADSEGKLSPVQDGDMLVHFAGLKHQKHEAVPKWLDRLERAPQELQIPLENTSYPDKLNAYWTRLRDARNILENAEDFISKATNTTPEVLLTRAQLRQTMYNGADKANTVLWATHRARGALAEAEGQAGGRHLSIENDYSYKETAEESAKRGRKRPHKRPRPMGWFDKEEWME